MTVEIIAEKLTFTLKDVRRHSATDDGIFLKGYGVDGLTLKNAGIRRRDLEICGGHIGFRIQQARGQIKDFLGENHIADILEATPESHLYLLVREDELALLDD